MYILNKEQMQEADRITISEYGVPSIVLMENAALSVLKIIEEKFPDISRVAVLCGKGNNGGDGLALARHLFNKGYDTKIYLFAKPKDLKGDPKINFLICQKMGIEIKSVPSEKQFYEIFPQLFDYPLIVDGLFGTGIDKPLEGFWANVVEAINSLKSIILSIDIPSGLSSSTGEVLGPAIKADVTATFGAYKIAHIFPPASNYCGKVHLFEIGIPRELISNISKLILSNKNVLRNFIPYRKMESHKGNFGHLVVVAGSKEKPGALSMSALGALRCGVGLLTCASVESALSVLHSHSYEAMGLILDQTPDGTIALSSLPKILNFLEDKDALVLGPGLSLNEETQEFIRRLVLNTSIPVVIDADGLNAFSKNLKLLKARKGDKILTPHPGELSRLLDVPLEDIKKDRIKYAKETVKESGSIVVLKGFLTLTANPNEVIWVNPTGNPGMATGGMGDILSGMIGAFLAQKIEAFKSAPLAVFLHGLAGDLAAKTKTEEGLIPRDLIEKIPDSFLEIFKNE